MTSSLLLPSSFFFFGSSGNKVKLVTRYYYSPPLHTVPHLPLPYVPLEKTKKWKNGKRDWRRAPRDQPTSPPTPNTGQFFCLSHGEGEERRGGTFTRSHLHAHVFNRVARSDTSFPPPPSKRLSEKRSKAKQSKFEGRRVKEGESRGRKIREREELRGFKSNFWRNPRVWG